MSQEFKEIIINNKSYVIFNSSAIDQFDILKILGANCALCGSDINNIDTIVGVLLSEAVSKENLAKIHETLSISIREKGKDYPISINDFDTNIFSYYQLIAESIKYNLSDFFTYLSDAKK